MTSPSDRGARLDIEAFLTRLVRLDPAALVRVRITADHPEQCVLWGRVPWNVLVTRTVEGWDAAPAGPDDLTVSATAWLSAAGAGPAALPRHDAAWNGPLPASGAVIETIPVSVIRRVADAAAATLRETSAHGLSGRAVGERAVRDALLDHVPIVVDRNGDQTTSGAAGIDRVEVPQRLVQAITRMGFLGQDRDNVQILQSGLWIAISAGHGTAWWRKKSPLAVHAARL